MTRSRSGLQLGPYEVRGVIARGGMGEVWRAHHPGARLDVAIKVLRPRGDPERMAAALEAEARAVASLDHPNIVSLYDMGTLEPDVARAAQLTPSSPWIAMELLSGGSLRSRTERSWSSARELLLSVLAGLAHAHARDLVHCDLKPANVLLGPRGVVKLADFGVARSLHGAREGLTGGTPAFMAPEQIRNAAADIGPAADLYALGCLAWWMVTGSAPFDGTVSEIQRAHLSDPLPPLRTRFAVSDGVADWLGGLLDKQPERRFPSAAHAALALRALDPCGTTPLSATPRPASRTPPRLSSGTPSTFTLSTQPLDPIEAAAPAPSLPTPVWAHPPVAAQPPLQDRDPLRAERLRAIGSGLALFGLRQVAMIGRARERETLWSALRRVQRTGRPSVVLIRGRSGYGKSRLARWLVQAATEHAGIGAVVAEHTARPTAETGVSAMLTRAFRLDDADAVRERIERVLVRNGEADPWVARALAELADPTGEQAGARFGSAGEKAALLDGWIRRMAPSGCTTTVWIDDAQWATELLPWVRRTRSREVPLPVLFVLTVQTEALADSPLAEALEALARDADTAVVELDALRDVDAATLTRELLGLSGPVHRQLTERAAGNPLHAVTLVADWVARGALVPGPDGFELAPGEALELPDDLHRVWSRRIEAVVGDGPDRRALELAATLGRRVSRSELDAVLASTGIQPSADLVERLARAGLADAPAHAPHWSFGHGMVRDAILREAGERQTDHHRACAEMLASSADGRAPLRRARHLLEAGEHGAALPVLIEASRVAKRIDGSRAGKEWLDLWAELAESTGLDRRSDAYLHGLMQRTSLAYDVQDTDGVTELAAEALALCDTPDRRVTRGKILAIRARGHRIRGDRQAMAEDLREAEAIFHEQGDPSWLRSVWVEQGWDLVRSGSAAQAIPLFERAIQASQPADRREYLGFPWRGLAAAHRALGRLEEAHRAYEIAQEHFEAHGWRWYAVGCVNDLSDVARHLGRRDEAIAGFREAREKLAALGSPWWRVAALNLALVLALDGDDAAAIAEVEAHLPSWLAGDRAVEVCTARAVLCCACAGLRRWPRFDEELEALVELLERSDFKDADLVELLDEASRRAERDGDASRSAAAAAASRAARP